MPCPLKRRITVTDRNGTSADRSTPNPGPPAGPALQRQSDSCSRPSKAASPSSTSGSPPAVPSNLLNVTAGDRDVLGICIPQALRPLPAQGPILGPVRLPGDGSARICHPRRSPPRSHIRAGAPRRAHLEDGRFGVADPRWTAGKQIDHAFFPPSSVFSAPGTERIRDCPGPGREGDDVPSRRPRGGRGAGDAGPMRADLRVPVADHAASPAPWSVVVRFSRPRSRFRRQLRSLRDSVDTDLLQTYSWRTVFVSANQRFLGTFHSPTNARIGRPSSGVMVPSAMCARMVFSALSGRSW